MYKGTVRITVGELNIEGTSVHVTRTPRKTVSVQLKADGIYVRAPLRMSDAEIECFLDSKIGWIRKHLRMVAEWNAVAKDLQPYSYEEMHELATKALQVIPERVKHYAGIIGVDYGNIKIRNQRTRWGSCSSKGNLNFNCLLMLLPDEIVDSVVVHELCHRKHMNHSPQFYAEVEKAFPNYQRCNTWLKENGGFYLSRLPQR